MKQVFIVILLAVSTFNYAQEDSSKEQSEVKEPTETSEDKKKSKFWKKVRFGGGVGLNFGNNFTAFALTPTAIYSFNEQFSLGAGIGYRYTKNNDFKNNVYSVSTLGLYNPISQLQLSSEFEYLFVNQKLDAFSSTYNYPALYLGIAYRIGRFSSIGISYDVLYDENKSIFQSPINPIIRVFF